VTPPGRNSLAEKALLALEELVQECRYRPPRRSFMIRFTLAYLWSLGRGEKKPFDEFWEALAREHWRFREANNALASIYRHVGIERDNDLTMRLWSERQREEEAIRAKGE
jgi:hypothetical protein